VCSLIARGIVAAGRCATVVAVIRALDHQRDAVSCDAIVAGLPLWFGDPDGIEACSLAVRTHAGLVAIDDAMVVGFLTYELRPAATCEITWMAVRADRRTRGLGSELVSELTRAAPEAGMIWVKTLSDRDGDPGREYSATRRFYEARGFRPMAELDIWGPNNPCQLLGKRIRPRPT
jgi:GNAT superfamily N-acetyltransferase